ncbi:MAG: hypothetical protein AAF439_04460, partial [Pseudomonadota bacterium]
MKIRKHLKSSSALSRGRASIIAAITASAAAAGVAFAGDTEIRDDGFRWEKAPVYKAIPQLPALPTTPSAIDGDGFDDLTTTSPFSQTTLLNANTGAPAEVFAGPDGSAPPAPAEPE